MAVKSAGLLFFRKVKSHHEVLLVHPGGPFWAKKDEGSWSIPKGEYADNESALDAAIREVKEEIGIVAKGPFIPLKPVKQKSGKWVDAWAIQSDVIVENIQSNTFKMEWPPRSGKQKEFPEIDRAEWFDPLTAKSKINPGQLPLLDELERLLSS